MYAKFISSPQGVGVLLQNCGISFLTGMHKADEILSSCIFQEAYWGPCQTSVMESFVEIGNG